MMLRVCLCSLSLSLTASTTDRCSRKPTSAVIVQHNCFGSTWLSFLLDSLQCVQRIRQNGNADGSFRGSAAAMVEFVTPSAMPEPGLSPCTAAALPGRKLLPALVNHFISARRTANRWVVAMLLREPIFAAICEARKAALANLARNQTLRCANVHHPTAATCPLGLNFSWWQDPEVLYAKWREHEKALLELAELTAKLATKLGVPTIATIEYAQLACSRGALSRELRRALGERSPASDRASNATSEKLSPTNPARAIRNLPEVAALFERRNKTAVARRLLSANESCAGDDLSTIDRRVWRTLSLVSDTASSALD